MIDTFGGTPAKAGDTLEFSRAMTDKIYAAAQPGAVFSAPVVAGAYTVITASEVVAGGGFGFGSGSGSSGQPTPGGSGSATGGGGGGGSSARPVAAIIIGPDGVKVEPIVDTTKVALAAIGAWLSIALLLARRSRATKTKTKS